MPGQPPRDFCATGVAGFGVFDDVRLNRPLILEARSSEELADADVATKFVAAPVWLYVLAQVCAGATLRGRRHRPYTVALTITAISLFAPAWAAVLAPYAVTAYDAGSRWRAWAVVGTLVTAFMVGAHAWAIDDPFTAPIVLLFSALLGLYARARRSLVAELTDRAERAERERLLLAEQARAGERIRLASEMHDVVTHRINLMVLQAGAPSCATWSAFCATAPARSPLRRRRSRRASAPCWTDRARWGCRCAWRRPATRRCWRRPCGARCSASSRSR
jgi:hypothetical protein